MFKKTTLAFLTSASFLAAGLNQAAAIDPASMAEPSVLYAQQPQQRMPVRTASAERPRSGGGLLELLFDGGAQQQPQYEPQGYYQPRGNYDPRGYEPRRQMMAPMEPRQAMRQEAVEPAHPAFDPKFEKQMVDYPGKEAAGTIVVDTPNKFLYLVQGGGKAMRYGIGVGRPGFTWSGVKQISAKKEWPAWTPPPEMLKRRPDLPRHMEGGPENPLGARAMYLGSSLYRIHGSNEPWTIGTNVSSGCIRMRNEDVIDLYSRVNVGARVVVI